VNVSSGTGSPGFSRKIQQSRKTVVVVVVVGSNGIFECIFKTEIHLTRA